jgi:pyruvate dehydrogenase (quinone)
MANQSTHSSLSPFFPGEPSVNRKSTKVAARWGGYNVAELLVELLHEAGVRRIFGVAGDALNGLTDALRRDGRIAWIGCRHEENAAYAAYATADLGQGLGVCAGTVGPGALHLINGLYNAKREGAGVLAITGQVPTHERGTGYFQEVDLAKMFDDVCELQAVISSPSQMLRLTEIAIQRCLSEKIVCRLEIPIDLMTMRVKNLHFLHPLTGQTAHVVPVASELDSALELMRAARKPSLLCGVGCRDAAAEVLALSERLQAPIAHTLRAKDIFDGRHENVVGLTGLIGTPPAYHATLDCDLLLMLGTNFPYENFLPSGVPIIQIDHEMEHIGLRAPVTIGLLGTVKETLQALLPQLEPAAPRAFLQHLRQMRARDLAHLRAQADLSRADEPLHPALFAQVISDVASSDAVFAVDVGESTVWAARHIEMRDERRMLGSFNHGSMGCALPIALGASSVDPARQVWAICGDGAFAMAMQDLVTAVRYRWPIKVIVFNNSELGFVKMENEVSGFPLDPDATGLVNPDFAALARACGAVGIKVEHAEDIEPAIRRAAGEAGPVVIDAIVTPGELTMPPTVSIKQAWGFGLSKLEEGLLGLRGDHAQWANWKAEFQANVGS